MSGDMRSASGPKNSANDRRWWRKFTSCCRRQGDCVFASVCLSPDYL